MSSCSPSRSNRSRITRTVVALLVAAAVGPAAAVPAAAAPLPPVTVFPAVERHVPMVIDIGAGTKPVPSGAVTVAVRGAAQPTTVVPALSDQLATSLVVDASPASGDVAFWLSGAARFTLEAPPASRTALIIDGAPPTVGAPLQRGPTELVRAISAVQPHGAAHTADALALALRQLPLAPAEPHLVVLYTGAGDAGGARAADLVTLFRDAHAILVVVSTTRDTRYWSEVTQAVGGFLAPAAPSTVNPAFDQVTTLLRTRYLLTIPTPQQLPAVASIRIATEGSTLTADATIPAPAAGGRSGSAASPNRHGGMLALAGLLLAGLLALVAWAAVPVARRLRARAGRPARTAPGTAPTGPEPPLP